MKILVVDDSRAMRLIVMRNLRHAGLGDATIVEASDGAQGLQLAADEKPDLILSDWNMPEMDGLTFLQELRATGSEITFGFVTSESGSDMRSKAIAAGAAFCLTKPFSQEEFGTVIASVVVA